MTLSLISDQSEVFSRGGSLPIRLVPLASANTEARCRKMDPTKPKVWLAYEAEKNGIKHRISIQKVTPDLYEPVIDHMVAHYLTREVKAKSINFVDDVESVQSIRNVWKELLEQGNGLVAILQNDKDAPPYGIVGTNITYVKEQGNEPDFTKHKGKKYSPFFATIVSMARSVDLYAMFGVTRILSALGLAAHPAYHGLHIGQKILEAREPLCKALGVKVSAHTFSASFVAEKAGFQSIKEWDCNTYAIDGEICFPNSSGKAVLMAKVFSS